MILSLSLYILVPGIEFIIISVKKNHVLHDHSFSIVRFILLMILFIRVGSSFNVCMNVTNFFLVEILVQVFLQIQMPLMNEQEHTIIYCSNYLKFYFQKKFVFSLLLSFFLFFSVFRCHHHASVSCTLEISITGDLNLIKWMMTIFTCSFHFP